MVYVFVICDFYDVDSYVMELFNFIIDYVDLEFCDWILLVNYLKFFVMDEEVDVIVLNGGKYLVMYVV